MKISHRFSRQSTIFFEWIINRWWDKVQSFSWYLVVTFFPQFSHTCYAEEIFLAFFSFLFGSETETMKTYRCRLIICGWHWTKNFGPKMKLKTEIERNENSIELLTLIFFFFSPFTQSRVLTTGRYVWQEVMTETESLLGEKKILSHEKWMKFEKLFSGHAR